TTSSTSSTLRRSCIFCRARKIRCSGGHICTACRNRNINCVYGLESRKGRPRNIRKGVAEAGLSLEGGIRKHDDTPTPRRGQTLGGELEQMFDEYFIRKLGSRSNLFQNSIASFQRHAQQQQQSLSSDQQKENPRSTLSYDGLLSFLAHEMVEILLLRVGHLGRENPGSGQVNFYITSLATDTTPAMFDRPQRAKNPISALGQHRVMQLVDIWFLMHPLSSLVSKTLLLSALRDRTVGEALLAIMLADACEVFSDSNIGLMSSSNDDQDPSTLVQYAADELKARPLPLPESATLSTAQVMIFLGWRELSRRYAWRATCYIRYICRIVARQHQQWQKQNRQDGAKLNGVNIADVEKEKLQNLYWLCLSSITWSFMQIDQPFSLLGPGGLPGFPSMDETTSAVLRLDQASGNISTLHFQIQTMRWLWPLSHVTSTVAHIYTLYLNTHRKLQSAHLYMLPWEIRDILDQAIKLVEREITTPNSQCFLFTAYHTIIIHMVFSPGQTTSSIVDAFCESTSVLLEIAQRFPSTLPSGLVPTQRTYSTNTLALTLDACSRALVHICKEYERQSMDTTNQIRDKLAGLAEQLREVCKADFMAQCISIVRPVKKRLKRVQLAYKSLGDASAPILDEDLNFSLNFVSWSDLINPVLGDDPAQLEFADPGFFVDDPVWGSLLGFPGFTQ
ncbi:Zn(II)2Cys6 transcription factor domain-containing protein, partial [Aspergillus glaucus CBS 516.65]